jgi:Dyp-type peroxidase family
MPNTVNPLPFLRDVQTGVLRAVKAQIIAYMFFRITDRQAFAKQLPDKADSANGLGLASSKFMSEAWRVEHPRPGDDVVPFANIAFTCNGLRFLGVDETTIASFPEVFREGMAHRAALLGDTGPAAPERWDGYLGSSEVHGVASATFHFPVSRPAADIVKAYEKLHRAISKISTAQSPIPTWPRTVQSSIGGQSALTLSPTAIQGADIVHVELGLANYAPGAGGDPDFPVEPFGFRDGISQPHVDIGLAPPPPGGGTPRAGDSWTPVACGELLLGYADEQDNIQRLPVNKELRQNGTYMVFRKLEQDVVAFRNFVKKHDTSGTPGKLAAQMVGRWPDGTPLVQHPGGPQSDQSAPSKWAINDFRYQADDPQGLRCPIGAHIRRANPRDTNNRDEARRHRLFRRGISYGGLPLKEGSSGDGNRRGTLFVSLQARIDRQFEIVQSHWLGRGELSGQAGAHADPLVGAHAGRVQDAFQAAGQPAPVTGLPRFVTLRGGDYFFVPSFTALAGMRAGSTFAPNDIGAPSPQDALGAILPSSSDNSAELVAAGKKLLMQGAPPFAPLPPVTKTPFPGAPPITLKRIVVGRHPFVKAVLEDDVHFSNAPFDETSRAILDGQQLLIGLARGPERDKRLKVLHDALQLMGGPLPVDEIARTLVDQVLDRVGPLGRSDIVADFGRVVPIMAAGKLFGIYGPNFVSPTAIAARFARLDVTDMPDDWLRTLPPVEDYAKPLVTMQAWTRLTFLQIFVNMAGARELIAPAERAAREFLRQIDDLIWAARSRASADKPGNLLEALARLPVDPKDAPDPHRHARLLLAEFTAGSVETLNAALAHLIDWVLDNKRALEVALCAHLGVQNIRLHELIGKLGNQDIDRLVYEILRFDPMGALAFRTCVAPGATIDGRAVEPGTLVCLVLASAMQDSTAFPSADKIRFDHPEDRYLHFGAGMHACAGQTISSPFAFPMARPLLREMFRAIASRPGLRRAAGDAGTRRKTFPLLVDGLTVRFEPTVR